MRVYQQQAFHGIPCNQPLKSPSPDIKGRNSIGPTMSPQQCNIRKSFGHFTPTNPSKKQSYIQYSTLPNKTQPLQSAIQKNIEQFFQPKCHQRPYQSTHAKGHYNFQLPRQLIINYPQHYENDLISTGKKIHHKQYHTESHTQHYPSQKTNTNSLRQQDLLKTIHQKDMIIHQLKGMINLMTQNGKHLKNSQKTLLQEEYETIKNQVKILTIENQKLSEVIQRLKQKDQKLTFKSNQTQKNQTQTTSRGRAQTHQRYPSSEKVQQKNLQIFKEYQQTISEFESQVSILKETLKEKQEKYQKEIDQLINSHKSLALECKMYETQKERFSRQNQRLINLLKLKQKQKQTCYANYSYVDKAQYESQQVTNTKTPSESVKSQLGSGNRLSIQKIKAQYEQNLKQYEQNVYNEVYNMFDSMNATLQEIGQKVTSFEQRIMSMQKLRNLIKPRTSSHLTSVEQNEEEIKKSAIYIEQAPSSERISSQSKSRRALSMILEESRRDNQKLDLQLSELRKEVSHYRKSLNQKSLSQNNQEQGLLQEEISSYQQKIKELQNLVDELREQRQTKQRELMRLQCQLLKFQESKLPENNIAKLQKENQFKKTSPQHQQDQASIIQGLTKQISFLKEQVSGRTQQQARLRQVINDLQKAQQNRQIQLLNQIESFQTLIKQTEQTFNLQKQQHHRNNQTLHKQIQTLALQIETYKQRVQVLQTQNDQLNSNFKLKTQRLLSQNQQVAGQLKEKLNFNENEIQRLDSYANRLEEEVKEKKEDICLLREEKQSWNRQREKYSESIGKFDKLKQYFARLELYASKDNFQAIEKYFQEVEQLNQKLSEQKVSLIETIQSTKAESILLGGLKLELTQRVNSLEAVVQLYKKQLNQTKAFYSTFLTSHQQQPETSNSPDSKLQSSSQKSRAKTKIHQLIDQQRDKRANLITIIHTLNIEAPSQIQSTQVEGSLP